METIKASGTCVNCGRHSQIDEHSSCFWCNNKMAQDGQVIIGQNRRNHCFHATGKPQFISSAQLHRDTLALVGKVPQDVVAVVGVARSGMVAATMLAMLIHKPLFTIRQTLGDVISCGNGWRLGGAKHVDPPKGRVIVVDDTVMTGNSLKAVAETVANAFPEHITAGLYVNPFAQKKPDIIIQHLPWPHLLEWNLFNSILSPNMACDFDGILCHDCSPLSDDDGKHYEQFIRTAQPLYTPRRCPIPLIITARIEKYRSLTMQWLERHQIEVNQLIMHPAATLRERRQDDIAAWKAGHFVKWCNEHRPTPPPNAFIESEDSQARRISELSGGMAICPASAKVYQSGG